MSKLNFDSNRHSGERLRISVCFLSTSWSQTASLPFRVEIPCSGLFTRRLLIGLHVLTDFSVLSLFLSLALIRDSLKIFPHFHRANWNTATCKQTAGYQIQTTFWYVEDWLTLFFRWKIILNDLKPKDSYNRGTLTLKTVSSDKYLWDLFLSEQTLLNLFNSHVLN